MTALPTPCHLRSPGEAHDFVAVGETGTICNKCLLFVRGQKKTVADIWKARNVTELVLTSLEVSPLETFALLSGGAAITASTGYFKLFVPWRHRVAPYSLHQLETRNRFGSALSNPAAKRTYLAYVVLSWFLDKVRGYTG